MIEAIANILKGSGAQQMNIIVRADDNGNATVILNTPIQATQKGESEQALKLRAALAQSIVLQGEIGEMDVEVTHAISQFSDTFVEAAQKHSSLIDVKAKVEQASKSTKAKKIPAKSQEKIPVADEEKASNEVKSEDNKTTTIETHQSVAEQPSADDFASGAADSL